MPPPGTIMLRARLDNISCRLDRVERRLDLVEERTPQQTGLEERSTPVPATTY
jgi:hypothetical protein